VLKRNRPTLICSYGQQVWRQARRATVASWQTLFEETDAIDQNAITIRGCQRAYQAPSKGIRTDVISLAEKEIATNVPVCRPAVRTRRARIEAYQSTVGNSSR
jgi:hypothetical protein